MAIILLISYIKVTLAKLLLCLRAPSNHTLVGLVGYQVTICPPTVHKGLLPGSVGLKPQHPFIYVTNKCMAFCQREDTSRTVSHTPPTHLGLSN